MNKNVNIEMWTILRNGYRGYKTKEFQNGNGSRRYTERWQRPYRSRARKGEWLVAIQRAEAEAINIKGP